MRYVLSYPAEAWNKYAYIFVGSIVVLVFAFMFRLEKPTFQLIAVISVMTVGVIMMVSAEAAFILIGFVLVMMASCLSGLRWSLTQMLLLRNPATGNPFSSIFFLAPVMFGSLQAGCEEPALAGALDKALQRGLLQSSSQCPPLVWQPAWQLPAAGVQCPLPGQQPRWPPAPLS